MPYTQTDIINLALRRIGNEQITDIAENSQPARVARGVYYLMRDAVLSAFPWNFALRRGVQLAAVAGEGTDDYLYAYTYPPEALNIWHLYNASSTAGPDVWPGVRELLAKTEEWLVGVSSTGSKIILTNIEQAKADFTQQITDPSLYDSLFIDAFAYRLAAEMAPALSTDKTIQANNLQLYKEALALAMGKQAAERKKEPDRHSRYILARRV